MKFKHSLLTTLMLSSLLGLSACGGGGGDSDTSSSDSSSSTPVIASDMLTITGMPTSFVSGEGKDVEFSLTAKALAIGAVSSGYCFSIADVSTASQKMFISPGYFCLASGRSQMVHFAAPAVEGTQSHQIKIKQEAGATVADIEAPVVNIEVKVNPDPDPDPGPDPDPDPKIAKVLTASGVAQTIKSGQTDDASFTLNAASLNVGSDLGESYCFALSDDSSYGEKLTFTPEDFCLTQVGSTQAVTIHAPNDVMQTQAHLLHISQTKQNPKVDDVELPLALSIEVIPLTLEQLAVTASNVPAKMYAQKDKTISVSFDKQDPQDQGALTGEYCFDLSDTTSATQKLSFSPSQVCFDNDQLGTSQDVVITAPTVSADEEHYLSFTQSSGDITVSLPNYDPIMVTPVTKPKLIGYFTNYGVYANNACVAGVGAPGKAIPFVSYPFPRQSYTIDGAPVFEPNGNTLCIQTDILQSTALGNTDLVNKLKSGKLTAVAYSFLFVYDDPANLPSGALAGQIRFTDSWSDLQASDNAWCKANNLNLRICTNNSTLTTASDFTWVTRYGNFSAFANLGNYAPDVDKIVSIGGWNAINWNVYQTGDSPTDTQRINNLVNSVKALATQFNITEVDLDVEEDGKTANFNNFLAGNNLAKIINRLHAEVTTKAGKQLKVSLTIQANPKYINALKSSVLSAENIDNLESLNLMTYDFTVPGISGYTGFNQVLFQPDAGTGQAPNEFTIDYAVQAAKQAMPGNEHKINMGLAAYTRALNGYNNSGITNNNGFGNPYSSSNTQLLGGDNDTASCSTELGLWNSCASSFNHRYFHQFSGQGTTHDFTQISNGETYHVGSTLIINGFNPPQPQSTFGYNTAPIAPKWDVTYQGNSVFFYTSGLDAFDYGRYSAEQGIGGAIMWTIDGDVPVTDTANSLIVNYYDGYMKVQE